MSINQEILETIFPVLKKAVARLNVPVVDLIAVQTRNNPFRILVATILSARTRDETTAKAAARLFKKAPDLASLSLLTESDIASLIHPVGFYHAKAGYLANLPQALKPFGSKTPDTMEGLLSLPGVGRKTANLVLNVAFNKPGICVDTHVHRIMNIWGYVQTRTPLQTEMALREKLPEHFWPDINSVLVAFGQGICKPVAPQCDICPIEKKCPKINVTPRKQSSAGRIMDENGGKKFISWNVNGIRAIEKKGFLDTVRDFDADILALQEIKAHPEQLSSELLEIQGYESFWHPATSRKGYSGICIYSKKKPLNVFPGMGNPEFDSEGRVLTLEYEDFFFVNSYFPNAQHGLPRIDFKIAFNRALHSFLNELASKKSVVICGDFNVAHKPIDLKNPKENEKNPGYSEPERAWMDEFTGDGYIDTFRKFNKEPDHYTWWSYRFNARARNIGWRIDYFCVDNKSETRVIDAGILPDIMGSDHCPVTLIFK